MFIDVIRNEIKTKYRIIFNVHAVGVYDNFKTFQIGDTNFKRSIYAVIYTCKVQTIVVNNKYNL